MSKVPKIHNKYCSKCKCYQKMELSVIKARSSGSLIKINRRRKLKYLTKGPGGKFTKNPARSTKTCKKPNLLFKCTACEAKRNWVHRRAVKFNLK